MEHQISLGYNAFLAPRGKTQILYFCFVMVINFLLMISFRNEVDQRKAATMEIKDLCVDFDTPRDIDN